MQICRRTSSGGGGWYLDIRSPIQKHQQNQMVLTSLTLVYREEFLGAVALTSNKAEPPRYMSIVDNTCMLMCVTV